MLIAQNVSGSDWVKAAAAIAVIVGHIFPVWLGFRGGKGVATGVGVFLVLAPVALLCAGVIFVSIVFFTRYVSLGSIMAAALIPLLVWLQNVFVEPVADLRPLLTAAVAGALLIIICAPWEYRATGARNGVSDLKQIAIIGAGSWGTALAVVAARAGHEVRLWSRNAEVVRSINEERVNSRYLSSTSIPSGVIATGDLGVALHGASIVRLRRSVSRSARTVNCDVVRC